MTFRVLLLLESNIFIIFVSKILSKFTYVLAIIMTLNQLKIGLQLHCYTSTYPLIEKSQRPFKYVTVNI